jgi:hypothetical protein
LSCVAVFRPVYEGGSPGDAATVRYFIARQATGKRGEPGALTIGLYSLGWVPPAAAGV